MARIAGVNVPENKHIEISLTHIYGIGRKTAQNICTDLKIDYTKKISDLIKSDYKIPSDDTHPYYKALINSSNLWEEKFEEVLTCHRFFL